MSDERIALLQYDNLRRNFNENLVDPILGKDYYNMGMDIYSCDQFTTEELKQKYDYINQENNILKIAVIVLLVVIALLLI